MIQALLLAIAIATGMTRSYDPYLAQVAASRIPQLERAWANPTSVPSLGGYRWGEVAGRNSGLPMQAVVDGWMASPEHRPILTDSYTRIGCAIATDRYAVTYFVCILATPSGQLLPNTASAPSSMTGGVQSEKGRQR